MKALTYDDIILEPQYSDIKSRGDVDLRIESKLEDETNFSNLVRTPIIAAPMNTVCSAEMASVLQKYNLGFGIIHRYCSIEEQVQMVQKVYSEGYMCGAAIGVTGDFQKRAQELVDNGINILCLDVAHGHHKKVKIVAKSLKRKFGKELIIIAGSIATTKSAYDYMEWGAIDVFRVGVGSGSICSTRLRTGHGVPNVTAIKNVIMGYKDHKNFLVNLFDQYKSRKRYIIADGGIRTAGDIVKAFAVGADYVMLGSLLAGTDEAPGEIIEIDGKKFKRYNGMASEAAQKQWRGEVSVVEGVSTLIPYKGSVKRVIEHILDGVRSGLSYSGARSIKEFKKKAVIIEQTNAGVIEAHPHIKLNGGQIVEDEI